MGHYAGEMDGRPGPNHRAKVEIPDDLRRKERIAMAKEICLYRGEAPWAVDRQGREGWEKYEGLAGAVIRESERLFALRKAP